LIITNITDHKNTFVQRRGVMSYRGTNQFTWNASLTVTAAHITIAGWPQTWKT